MKKIIVITIFSVPIILMFIIRFLIGGLSRSWIAAGELSSQLLSIEQNGKETAKRQ